MSALALGAGTFVAAERDYRALVARLRVAQWHGVKLCSNAIIVTQVWRDPQCHQPHLVRLLGSVDVRPVDDEARRAAGVLIGQAGTQDPSVATLALVAHPSDPQDMKCLIIAAGRSVPVTLC